MGETEAASRWLAPLTGMVRCRFRRCKVPFVPGSVQDHLRPSSCSRRNRSALGEMDEIRQRPNWPRLGHLIEVYTQSLRHPEAMVEDHLYSARELELALKLVARRVTCSFWKWARHDPF
jgi:hypothetical protein